MQTRHRWRKYRKSLTLDNQVVGVDVRDSEATGEQATDLRLASSRQPDEDDGQRDAHARSPTTSR